MSVREITHSKLKALEKRIEKASNIAAPTVPIYDPTSTPQDPILGQVAVGTDNSFMWYDGTSWHTKAGIPST